MSVTDEILSREAQFIYERAYGFEAKEGNLRRWKGYAPVRLREGGETAAEIEIVIPDHFPEVPPTVYVHTPMSHPNIEDGLLAMRMLARWRSTYHIFQVIVEIKRLFQKVPAKMIETPQTQWVDPQTQLAPLLNQKNQLATILKQKKTELNELSARRPSSVSSHVIMEEKSKYLEEEILNVENELFGIESQFDDYDISALEFTKKYHALKKRLYLLESQVECD